MLGPRRQSCHRQTRRVATSLSVAFIALIALFCLCPVPTNAADRKAPEPSSEYGTVIGIGG